MRATDFSLDPKVHWTAADVEPILQLIIKRDYNTIASINLTKCRLPDSVGELVATLIEKSTTLARCYLAKNMFTEKTMLSIARALKKNTSVVELHLHSNRVWLTNTNIMEAFVAAVSHNPNRPKDTLWRFSSSTDDNMIWRTISRQAAKK